MLPSTNILPFPLPAGEQWVTEYLAARVATRRRATTVEAYSIILHQFTAWVARRPGNEQGFHPSQLSQTAVDVYLNTALKSASSSHKQRVKSVISGFAQWLIDEKGMLSRNPTYGIALATQQALAPRELDDDQRYILRELVEKDDLRGKALFALGYWAGCRVSDAAHLLMEHTHVGPKVGWLHIGYKGEKFRDIDLRNEVRGPLYDYIHHGGRKRESLYVFTSQRPKQDLQEGDLDPWRFTEEGIHAWFRVLKSKATHAQWEHIHDITFHDLRHDFAHRARQAGWSLEEVAVYLGHVTNRGTPAVMTTARYTQPSREQIKQKLKDVPG